MIPDCCEWVAENNTQAKLTLVVIQSYYLASKKSPNCWFDISSLDFYMCSTHTAVKSDKTMLSSLVNPNLASEWQANVGVTLGCSTEGPVEQGRKTMVNYPMTMHLPWCYQYQQCALQNVHYQNLHYKERAIKKKTTQKECDNVLFPRLHLKNLDNCHIITVKVNVYPLPFPAPYCHCNDDWKKFFLGDVIICLRSWSLQLTPANGNRVSSVAEETWCIKENRNFGLLLWDKQGPIPFTQECCSPMEICPYQCITADMVIGLNQPQQEWKEMAQKHPECVYHRWGCGISASVSSPVLYVGMTWPHQVSNSAFKLGSFFPGRRSSIFIVSIRLPRKVTWVPGPFVLWWATGTPSR